MAGKFHANEQLQVAVILTCVGLPIQAVKRIGEGVATGIYYSIPSRQVNGANGLDFSCDALQWSVMHYLS